MARARSGDKPSPDAIISIIGPGMTVVGDCETEGSIRIEGNIAGSIRAGKAVVVGEDAWVKGDICLLYTSPSPRDKRQSRMPSSA